MFSVKLLWLSISFTDSFQSPGYFWKISMKLNSERLKEQKSINAQDLLKAVVSPNRWLFFGEPQDCNNLGVAL